MDRWLNRTVVVTGASSGIGAACCKMLVAKGMVVVGLARREDRLKQLQAELSSELAARFHIRKCDVSDEQQVVDAFTWICKTLGGVDVLVNNAGITRFSTVTEKGNSGDLRSIVDTNVMGVAWCTREAFQSMQSRQVNDGHVVIINSVAGHIVPHLPMNLYSPSKHAVTALTEVLRAEFMNKGTKIKITSVSPGAVDTEIIDKTVLPDLPMLRAEDIADAVIYCIQTPPNVQIHELIIKPIGER
ncbi:hypothetical protein KR093_000060 [Drosophila rubida]|uniref:Farnesol dehydrogenase n=1 Tax=Drosophila rubida TaxID=30044 RepID=A0AAD4JRR2_9MUSC|nr:hypothetical protein KR093_000060 [Drosophila rubida]